MTIENMNTIQSVTEASRPGAVQMDVHKGNKLLKRRQVCQWYP